ncbi:MAG: T9SS type A sorting domain-containing protein, partial [Candidatus Kapaibacterium sp.]
QKLEEVSVFEGAPNESKIFIDVRPNPSDGIAVVSYQIPVGLSGEIEFYMADLTGRFVYRKRLQPFSNDEFSFNSNEYPQGIYLYGVILNGEIKTSKKFIIR